MFNNSRWVKCINCLFFRQGGKTKADGTCHFDPPTVQGFGLTRVDLACSKWQPDFETYTQMKEETPRPVEDGPAPQPQEPERSSDGVVPLTFSKN